MGGFMKYAVEMGSGAIIYIPSFKDYFSHSEVIRGDTQTGWVEIA
jgi:hypothetical protein